MSTPQPVRYCGPTSSIHHHHLQKAASGVNHVWTAVIVAGLSVVVTGAIVFGTSDLETARASQSTGSTTLQLRELNQRLIQLEIKLQKLQNTQK